MSRGPRTWVWQCPTERPRRTGWSKPSTGTVFPELSPEMTLGKLPFSCVLRPHFFRESKTPSRSSFLAESWGLLLWLTALQEYSDAREKCWKDLEVPQRRNLWFLHLLRDGLVVEDSCHFCLGVGHADLDRQPLVTRSLFWSLAWFWSSSGAFPRSFYWRFDRSYSCYKSIDIDQIGDPGSWEGTGKSFEEHLEVPS